jgi:hypothetical protein
MIDNKFTVSVQNLSEQPVATGDGSVFHAVSFRVLPDGAEGEGFHVDAGEVRGEVLDRALALQQKGAITVTMPAGWTDKEEGWQQHVVDAALDHAKSESA